jgi:DNA-directed RNA polymerase I subunit RPA2
MDCIITKPPCPKLKAAISTVLVDIGMIPLSIADWLNSWKDSYTVVLDGKVIGLIEDKIINKVVCYLRMLKIEGKEVG